MCDGIGLRSILGLALLSVLAIRSPATGGVLYSNTFTNVDGITASAGVSVSTAPAPGGKPGNALRIYNGTSNGYVELTPNVALPSAVTVFFRYYISSHTSFQGVYNYPPGEGLRVRDDGRFGDSWDHPFSLGWQEGTWYTIALVLLDSGVEEVYIREGANAVLTSADRVGTVSPAAGRPMNHTTFFNYGGEIFVADYTILEGVDFGVITCTQDFDAGIGGWNSNGIDGGSWTATDGLVGGGYHRGSRATYYPSHEPWADPDRSTFTAGIAARYTNVIEISYWVKDFSATEAGAGPVVHALVSRPTSTSPSTRWNLQLLPSFPTDWTRVACVFDTNWTDEQAMAAGWTRVSGAGSWQQLFAVDGVPGSTAGLRSLFGTSTGSYSGTRTTGVDCANIARGQLPKPMGRYRLPLTITSALPCPNVPMDPSIPFGDLLQTAAVEGVLDQNSIAVKDLATGQFIPRAIERFSNTDTLNVEWVIENPAHTQYEICFNTVGQRPAILPADYTPMIGVGDLLHYNAGEARPIVPIFLSGLYDVTGDGKPDLVGVWNYGRRPGDRWDGVIVFPRVGDLDEFKFGDMFRIYEVPDVRYSHGDMGDFDKDGAPDIVFSPSSGSQITTYHNTGARHATLMPVYATAGSAMRPSGSGSLMRVVDLDGDGALDVVASAGFPNAETGATTNTAFLRNTNGSNWPPSLQSVGTLNIDGVNPAFFDVDDDGRPDAVSLIVDPTDPGLSGYSLAWQQNLGGSPPSFGPGQLITEINSQVWRPIDVAAVNDGPQRGLLVEDRNWQRVQFFVHVVGQGGPPYFQFLGTASSVSAEMALSDQASPYVTDWNGDGNWDLVVGGGYGWPQVVLNTSTNTRPAFAESQLILSEGEPIRLLRNVILGQPYLWHNMGYPWPIYEDWDLDGLPDLVLANETNRIFWYKNVGTRQAPLFGPQQQVLIDGYPDSPALRQLSAQRALTAVYPTEAEEPFFWRTRASFVDFNGDGLRDLVTMDGAHANLALYVRYRDGQEQLRLRKWRDDPRLQTVSGGYIGGQAFCADWDGDGLIDVIASRGGGDPSGTVFLYRNVGTPTEPVMADARPMYCYGQPISLTWHGPHPAVGDMNGDGKPDLLCYTEWSVYGFYSHVAIEMPQRPTYTLGDLIAAGAPADLDADGDVDLTDFLDFQVCFNGPNRPPAASGCADADFDLDGDVDLTDFLVFQRCFNGPNRPPNRP
jgi:hypothetical protein